MKPWTAARALMRLVLLSQMAARAAADLCVCLPRMYRLVPGLGREGLAIPGPGEWRSESIRLGGQANCPGIQAFREVNPAIMGDGETLNCSSGPGAMTRIASPSSPNLR